MGKYWFFYRNSDGYPMRGIVYAANAFLAYEQAKAMYGKNMISEGVCLDNT